VGENIHGLCALGATDSAFLVRNELLTEGTSVEDMMELLLPAFDREPVRQLEKLTSTIAFDHHDNIVCSVKHFDLVVEFVVAG